MVQIPEYTRRDTFEATSRPSANLQLPDAIASSQGKNVFGLSIDNLRTVAKGAGEVAKEMVEMKNDYDNAKADEYIVDYMRSADAEIQKYQTERKGDLANGLIEDFEKFSENAFDTATNVNQETQRALLENKEQRDIARRKMDNINLNYFRSISAYQAKEIESYKQNKATAVVSSYLEKATTESDPVNIQNLLFDARKKIETLYPGQSEEYVNLQFKQLTSGVLAQNVVQESITSPDRAVWKMTTPVFKDNMDPKDFAETKAAVFKSVKSFYSDKISEDVLYLGKVTIDENEKTPSTVELNTLLESELFEKTDVDAFRKEIINEASSKLIDKRDKKQKQSVELQNATLLGVIRSGGDVLDMPYEAMTTLMSTPGGAATMDLINEIKQKTNDEVQFYGEISMELSENDMLDFVAVSRRVRQGYYETMGEMFNDIQHLPSSAQKEIVGSFLDELKYKDYSREIEAKGIDLEKQLQQNFHSLTGLYAEKDPKTYYTFRTDCTNKIIAAQTMGKTIDTDLINSLAASVVNTIYNSRSDSAVIKKIQFDLGTYLKDTPNTTLTDTKKQVHTLFNATDLDNVLSEKQQDRIEDMIVKGEIDEAIYTMNYYREAYYKKPEKVTKEETTPSLFELWFESGGTGLNTRPLRKKIFGKY